MDAYKKSMLFLLAIALLVCSSYADSLPQARMEERKLAPIGRDLNFFKNFDRFAGKEKWWNRVKEGFPLVKKAGKAYYKAGVACMKIYNCTAAKIVDRPICGYMCVLDAVARTAENSCVKYCREQEERSANPQLNCFYHAGGRITCN